MNSSAYGLLFQLVKKSTSTTSKNYIILSEKVQAIEIQKYLDNVNRDNGNNINRI